MALDKPCDCGLTLPLMGKVKGRVSDSLHLPNGTMISGEYLTTLFDDEPEAVKRFQVVQRADASIDVLAVPNRAYTRHREVLDVVKERLLQQVDRMVPVRVSMVESLPSQAGKLRFVRSEFKGS